MNGKKPRKGSISIELPPEARGGKFGFNKETGEVVLLGANGQIVSTQGLVMEHYYDGSARRVQLSRLVAGSKCPLRGLSELDFLATYDVVYVVDTNTLETSDGKVHRITSFFKCCTRDLGYAHTLRIYEGVRYFHFAGLKCAEPEKAGWISLFNHDLFQHDLQTGLKIAVIVDAYLGQLAEYNTRAVPIMACHFVPSNVTLMYAKADKSDNPTNKLINVCDQLAREYKRKFSAGEVHIVSQRSPIFECESYWSLREHRLISTNPTVFPKENIAYGVNASVELYGIDDDGKKEMIKKLV